MRNCITEPGRAPLRLERGQTCRVTSAPGYALHSPQGLFLARADSLTFACSSLCHKVCLPSRSKEPTHGNLCCGWPCSLPEPPLYGIIKVPASWEGTPGGGAGVDFMTHYKR